MKCKRCGFGRAVEQGQTIGVLDPATGKISWAFKVVSTMCAECARRTD